MSRGGSGGGGGHWKESPKKNAMNELQDKLMTVRLREAEAQAELREVKLKALQLESQVSDSPGGFALTLALRLLRPASRTRSTASCSVATSRSVPACRTVSRC